MGNISIEGMTFRAYHGCMEEEQVIGNTFVVDLYLDTDTTKAEQSDSLGDTADYAEAYKIVQKEMEIPSKLLEHVGRRIIEAIKNAFPEIEAIEVRVAKMNPPINGQAESVSVTLSEDYDLESIFEE
ncbi:MAG: dihydroneopterin aldolase [Bacteroidales bacterium]